MLEQIMTVAGNEQGSNYCSSCFRNGSYLSLAAPAAVWKPAASWNNSSLIWWWSTPPYPDEHGEAVARLAFRQGAAVILLVKAEHADAVWERIGKTGIYLIAKPFKRAVFLANTAVYWCAGGAYPAAASRTGPAQPSDSGRQPAQSGQAGADSGAEAVRTPGPPVY